MRRPILVYVRSDHALTRGMRKMARMLSMVMKNPTTLMRSIYLLKKIGT